MHTSCENHIVHFSKVSDILHNKTFTSFWTHCTYDGMVEGYYNRLNHSNCKTLSLFALSPTLNPLTTDTHTDIHTETQPVF